MARISIGFVISTLNRAGAERKLVAVANGLDRSRFEPHVLVLKSGPLVDILEIPCWDNIIPSKFCIRGFFRLISIIRKAKLDVLWVVGTGDAGFFGRLAAKLAGVRIVILSFHATTRPNGKATIDSMNRILNRLPCLTDRFVSVAASHMKHMIDAEGIDPLRITFIHNGVDCSMFRPFESGLELFSTEELPESAPVVGILARFKSEKRHDLFLQAGKLLGEDYPDLRFLMVGDGPLMNETKAVADSLGISDKVYYTGGLDYVLPALHRMTVSVLCSDMEAFPNTVLESMAAGIPVVATDVGSVSEAITDGINGKLVPRRDSQCLADAIDSLLKDSELRESISKAARKKVVDYFSLDQMIRKREELFEELLQTKRSD